MMPKARQKNDGIRMRKPSLPKLTNDEGEDEDVDVDGQDDVKEMAKTPATANTEGRLPPPPTENDARDKYEFDKKRRGQR